MTAQVIQTKRQPPYWAVKARGRYQAYFSGPDGRAQAEAHAAERYGEFKVLVKPETGKEAKRAAFLAAQAEAAE